MTRKQQLKFVEMLQKFSKERQKWLKKRAKMHPEEFK